MSASQPEKAGRTWVISQFFEATTNRSRMRVTTGPQLRAGEVIPVVEQAAYDDLFSEFKEADRVAARALDRVDHLTDLLVAETARAEKAEALLDEAKHFLMRRTSERDAAEARVRELTDERDNLRMLLSDKRVEERP